MAQTLLEYAEWLEGREDLIWPKPPKLQRPKASPFTKPLAGIRAVTWNVYGTLLHISDGRLLLMHPQELRMQVALEKTIEEFHMWQSMSRKPGAPWEYMLIQYKRLVEDAEMAGTNRPGDFPRVDAARIWRKLIGRLLENEYTYDESFYGDLEELSEKVAFFFHKALQGVEPMPQALETLTAVTAAGRKQGLLSDSQPFTLVEMLRALRRQGTLPPLDQLVTPTCLTLSHQEGVRQPSKSLYAACVRRFRDLGIEPHEILHVGSRLREDLAVAKQFGMKTALFAGDKESLQATPQEVKDPTMKPDRLLTDLAQLKNILGIS
ncbi:MAG TPA: HAD family hydrolase [Planctomycetaceae bacterium]|nr:HAD family hydrolase [Planctomycetaceae bacterium]